MPPRERCRSLAGALSKLRRSTRCCQLAQCRLAVPTHRSADRRSERMEACVLSPLLPDLLPNLLPPFPPRSRCQPLSRNGRFLVCRSGVAAIIGLCPSQLATTWFGDSPPSLWRRMPAGCGTGGATVSAPPVPFAGRFATRRATRSLKGRYAQRTDADSRDHARLTRTAGAATTSFV